MPLFAELCVRLPAKTEPQGALVFIGITQKFYFSYPGFPPCTPPSKPRKWSLRYGIQQVVYLEGDPREQKWGTWKREGSKKSQHRCVIKVLTL